MYDVGDEEDKRIAKQQEKDAQERDEMPDAQDQNPDPKPEGRSLPSPFVVPFDRSILS